MKALKQVDVAAIDANINVTGNHALTFRGTGNLVGTGSIVFRQFDNAGSANDRTFVYFKNNGDGGSDIMIELRSLKALTAGDFVL